MDRLAFPLTPTFSLIGERESVGEISREKLVFYVNRGYRHCIYA